MSKKDLSRRDFVAGAGKVALGAAILPSGFPPGFPMIVPRHVLGRGFRVSCLS